LRAQYSVLTRYSVLGTRYFLNLVHDRRQRSSRKRPHQVQPPAREGPSAKQRVNQGDPGPYRGIERTTRNATAGKRGDHDGKSNGQAVERIALHVGMGRDVGDDK